LAREAVPNLLVATWPGAYHSQTMVSLRMTRKALVFRAANPVLNTSSLFADKP
jgi:hypothetical protein